MLPERLRTDFFEVVNDYPVVIVHEPGDHDGSMFRKFKINPDNEQFKYYV